MATIAELIPYLEQGYTLRSNRGESLRLVAPGLVRWIRAKGFRFEDEVITLAEVRAMSDLWSWDIVGTTQGGQE